MAKSQAKREGGGSGGRGGGVCCGLYSQSMCLTSLMCTVLFIGARSTLF